MHCKSTPGVGSPPLKRVPKESPPELMSDTMPTAEERDRLLVEGAKHYAMILLDAEGRV